MQTVSGAIATLGRDDVLVQKEITSVATGTSTTPVL